MPAVTKLPATPAVTRLKEMLLDAAKDGRLTSTEASNIRDVADDAIGSVTQVADMDRIVEAVTRATTPLQSHGLNNAERAQFLQLVGASRDRHAGAFNSRAAILEDFI